MIPTSVNEQLRQYGERHFSGRVLALVDGIQYQQHTGQQLTPENDRTVSLFAGTNDMALAHAGPWLFDPKTTPDHLANLRELEQARPGVIWLITSESLERQAAKLRPHLNTRIPDGRSALLRFRDPQGVACAQCGMPRQERARSFQGCRSLALPQRRTTVHHQRQWN
ncbi:DUF4123 domain-containing protein [Paraburkholderia sp. CI3]|uniref:DUF4123 domain-containing protein n=1 Tax=Paraburkholderia sp. CI3 TaxID=2991060 RepID=UPI003D21C7AF